MNLDFHPESHDPVPEKVQNGPARDLRRHIYRGPQSIQFQIIDDLKNMMDRASNGIVLAPEASIFSAINYAYDNSRDTAEEFIQTMDGESTDSIISEIEEPRPAGRTPATHL